MCNLMNILKFRKNCFDKEGRCLKMGSTFEVEPIKKRENGSAFYCIGGGI